MLTFCDIVPAKFEIWIPSSFDLFVPTISLPVLGARVPEKSPGTNTIAFSSVNLSVSGETSSFIIFAIRPLP